MDLSLFAQNLRQWLCGKDTDGAEAAGRDVAQLFAWMWQEKDPESKANRENRRRR